MQHNTIPAVMKLAVLLGLALPLAAAVPPTAVIGQSATAVGAPTPAATVGASKAAAGREYPPPSAPQRDIAATPLYKGGTHGSVIDPVSSKKRKELVRPFKEFMATTRRMSDWYIEDGDAKAAQCGIRWFRAWADRGAALGKLENLDPSGKPDRGGIEAQVIQVDFLTDVSQAWLKLKPAAGKQDQTVINAWLHKIAARAQTFERSIPPGKRNNIYYWHGLAIMAVGIATQDPDYLAEAKKIYKFALTQIQDDGTLPLEMARRGRALIYHAKAAGLLSGMAKLAQTQGQNWYRFDNQRLALLVDRVQAGHKDPSYFEARAHAKQEVQAGK